MFKLTFTFSTKKIIFLWLIIFSLFFFLSKPKSISNESSFQFYSTEGYLLKEYSSTNEEYAQIIGLEEVPEIFQSIILVAEDKRFYYHPGFDPIAIIRSIWKNIWSGRIVSGASTITQQLVRIIYRKEFPKNLPMRKFLELLYAVKFELHYSKKQILQAYINQINIRHNYSGIASSSKYLFKRPHNFLTKEEMIGLTILIRQNQPDRDKFKYRFENIWGKVFGSNTINYDAVTQVENQIFQANHSNPQGTHLSSRHFTDWLQKFPTVKSGKIYTNISSNRNDSVKSILNSELKTMQGHQVENGAVVILKLPDNNNSSQLELISMVGSKDFNEREVGQVNGCVRTRQAGSTLKPFLYGLAFDKNILKPNSILEDKEMKVINDKNEIYIPRNNDLDFWGNLTVSESLANSRNIPAVRTFEMVGSENFLKLLIHLGLDHLDKSAEHYGSSIVLGTGGASLLQLTRAYSALANKGKLYSLNIGKDTNGKKINLGEEQKIFSEQTAYRLTSILSDKELRRRAYGERNFFNFPFSGVAVKTGTTKDFKDAWAVGFTTEYAIGVWVGNFHGNPMHKISGGYGAGKIFHQVVRLLHREKQQDFLYPTNYQKKKYCKLTGLTAAKNCPQYLELINTNDKPDLVCDSKHSQDRREFQDRMILSPTNFESFLIDPTIPLRAQAIPIIIQRIDSTKREGFYFYSIDGQKRIEIKSDIKESLTPSRGIHKIFIYKENQIIEETEFSVE
ncbi:MAG: transglycosylase domain-containing protein [Leptospiraceae bacterium]|nr:transglycosylase domain-containing protein [Leptospiraceae bacterium]